MTLPLNHGNDQQAAAQGLQCLQQLQLLCCTVLGEVAHAPSQSYPADHSVANVLAATARAAGVNCNDAALTASVLAPLCWLLLSLNLL
jgi:hypothetical protein